MIDRSGLEAVVARANLAPSVHNAQPARWRLVGEEILIAADPAAALPVGDPDGRDAALSCGAAVEATRLALGAAGIAAAVEDVWAANDTSSFPGHRLAAILSLRRGAEEDGLHHQLEKRFTWRGPFRQEPVELFGWTRSDAALVLDAPRKGWLAQLNDEVSHEIMDRAPFRRELTSWMRLRKGHRRYRHDGLSREALGMSVVDALATPLVLGPGWGLLRAMGQTRGLVAEASVTAASPVIACFHAPRDGSMVTAGRAYLRLCLEAASLGLAGWPMAALTDHPRSRSEIEDRLGLAGERRLVQVIRFGAPGGAAPPRARRPIAEILLGR